MTKKFLLITGAATGIGLATSKKFAANGWNVISTVLPKQKRDELQSIYNIKIIELDITNQEMVSQVYEQIDKITGKEGLALLINNAGIANIGSGALEGVPMEDIRFCYDVNVFGTIHMIKSFLPLLRRYGKAKIINLASGAVRAPVPFAAVYNSTKYSVLGISKTLRYELAPFGIQVSCIEPSTVKSEMTNGHEENMKISWRRMTKNSVNIYTESIKPTNEWLSKQIVNAIAPEEIANKIYNVQSKRHLRIRYGGGSMAEFLSFTEGFMGENLFEKLLMKMIRVPKNKFIGKG